METKKLPTIAELTAMELSDKDKSNALTVLLNQPPPAAWVKRNPFAGNSEYLPIDKIEFLLTKIFGDWFVRIKNSALVGNSVEVTLTLFYRPIVDELSEQIEWLYKHNGSEIEIVELKKIKYSRRKEDWYEQQDGIGAAAIQVDAGEKASAFDKIKPNGIAIASPKAESVALGDAADKIGRIFGKDLNRKDLIDYSGLADMDKFKGATLKEY